MTRAFGEAPFRSAPIREHCQSCSAPAEVRCERCGSPLCASHAPAAGQRCTDCEAIFQARVGRPIVLLLPLGCWLLAMLGGGTWLTLTATGVHFNTWLALLLSTFFLAPFVVGATRSLYSLVARWRFLRERDDRCRQPLSHDLESWFEIGESW